MLSHGQGLMITLDGQEPGEKTVLGETVQGGLGRGIRMDLSG